MTLYFYGLREPIRVIDFKSAIGSQSAYEFIYLLYLLQPKLALVPWGRIVDIAAFNARFDLGLRVMGRVPKAAVIAMMTAASVLIFSGSYWKAFWIGTFAFFLSMFTTWRRYVEPISFFVFLAAVVVTCTEPSTLAKIQTAVLTLTRVR